MKCLKFILVMCLTLLTIQKSFLTPNFVYFSSVRSSNSVIARKFLVKKKYNFKAILNVNKENHERSNVKKSAFSGGSTIFRFIIESKLCKTRYITTKWISFYSFYLEFV